jgi:hypothetical protein
MEGKAYAHEEALDPPITFSGEANQDTEHLQCYQNLTLESKGATPAPRCITKASIVHRRQRNFSKKYQPQACSEHSEARVPAPARRGRCLEDFPVAKWPSAPYPGRAFLFQAHHQRGVEFAM